MFDPNEWFALVRAAQRRNEDPITEEYRDFPNKRDIWEIGEALDFAHNAAVEGAATAGEEAYISAFQAEYDRTHQQTYNGRAPASLKVPYKRANTKPHRVFDGIIPYKWCELMYDALNRNQEIVWRELKPLANKDLNMVDKLLAEAHVAAVQAANLCAKQAYIRAFNASYDQQHCQTYECMLGADRIRQIAPLATKSSEGLRSRRPDAKKQ
jgi:hypothetical protein